MTTITLILLIITLVVISILIIERRIRLNAKSKIQIKKIKPNSIVDMLPKPKEEKVKEKFLAIETFNTQSYLNTLFSDVYYSILNESMWSHELSYSTITFSREQSDVDIRGRAITKKIEVEIRFEFEYNTKEMKLTKVELKDNTNYTSFKTEGPFSDELLQFVYKIYRDTTIEQNEKAKATFEKNIQNVRSVLGKSVQRGSKLDDLLNG